MLGHHPQLSQREGIPIQHKESIRPRAENVALNMILLGEGRLISNWIGTMRCCHSSAL